MSAPALPPGTHRWIIKPIEPREGWSPFVVVASSPSAAWAKFVRQLFGTLKPNRKDYCIARAS